jgi:predicted metal-dependent phosphoesterase TrpH
MPAALPVAVERHPHLADPVRRGWWRVDLHSHTMWSGDSTSTPEEIAVAVAESGLDVVCITDHQEIAGAQQLAHDLPCGVIVGEEIKTTAGEIIGLFLDERVPPGMSPSETADAIRQQAGLVYIPHPFDPLRRCLGGEALSQITAMGLVDAIEVFNAKASMAHVNASAAAFCAEHDLVAGAGSDAHVPDALGAAYVEMPEFGDAVSFLDALRVGRVVGHRWDRARPWTARVVPSVSSDAGGGIGTNRSN